MSGVEEPKCSSRMRNRIDGMARSRKNESKMIVMRIEDNYPKSILVGEWRLWIGVN